MVDVVSRALLRWSCQVRLHTTKVCDVFKAIYLRYHHQDIIPRAWAPIRRFQCGGGRPSHILCSGVPEHTTLSFVASKTSTALNCVPAQPGPPSHCRLLRPGLMHTIFDKYSSVQYVRARHCAMLSCMTSGRDRLTNLLANHCDVGTPL